MKKLIKNIGLYIWQLPQNLLGLILIMFYHPKHKHIMDDGIEIHYSSTMLGGISLGKYTIVNTNHYRKDIKDSLKRDTVRHEAIGHTKQSRIFGPLYLIIIGLPSITWAGMYGTIVKRTTNGYYRFWTEAWADKIAGVKR